MSPERLDNLPATDPLAVRSRRDLRRVHRAMRSLSILKGAVTRLSLAAQPRRILELGAGDGTLLLRLAGALRPRWSGVELTLLDREDLLSSEVREAYRQLDWQVSVLTVDALDWVRSQPPQHYDLCLTTLFLHHLENADLGLLLAGVAARSDAFIACEPRRNHIARVGSHLIGLLGTNEVTREDGIKSVAAGFSDSELSQVWHHLGGGWHIEEYLAWPFTHCFLAARPRAALPRHTHGR